MNYLKFLSLIVMLSALQIGLSQPAKAQIDVRFTEVPKYSSSPCASGRGNNLSYRKAPSGADTGYRAMFGVWCAVNQNAGEFLLAISAKGTPFPGRVAHPIEVNVLTTAGFEQGYGVAFFDTRQKRWAIVLQEGETWVMWAEGNGKLGQAQGRYRGDNIRMHKGRNQTWVLLNRVK